MSLKILCQIHYFFNMTYDIASLLLIIMAFIGGFQAGIIRIFGLALACTFAILCTIWCVPYIKQFMTASMTQVPVYSVPLISLIIFALITWTMAKIIRMLWKPADYKKNRTMHNLLGGAILSVGMLLSISILFGFVDKSSVITPQTKQESIAYKILMPIHSKSKDLWSNLTANSWNRKSANKAKEII